MLFTIVHQFFSVKMQKSITDVLCSRYIIHSIYKTLYTYTEISLQHTIINGLAVTGSVVSSEVCLSTRAYKLTSYLKGVI